MSSIRNFDLVSCLLVLTLMLIGLVNIYSVTYFENMDFFSTGNFFGKQLFFFFICILTFFISLTPDIKFYFKYASIIYLLIKPQDSNSFKLASFSIFTLATLVGCNFNNSLIINLATPSF